MADHPTLDSHEGSHIAVVIKTNEGGLWLVPQVRELLSRGARVLVILPAGDGRLSRTLATLAAEEPCLRIEAVPFDFALKLDLRTVRGIRDVRRVLTLWDVDTVFYHLYASALTVRIATLGMRRLRKVHMVAGPLYLENRAIRLVERLLWRFDTTVIAGSEFTRQRYLEIGADDRRLCAVPYGVDTRHFRRPARGRPDARHALGLTEQTFVVVMVAYVYAPKSLVFPGVGIKGHELAIEAWSTVFSERSDVRLLFVGSGFHDDGTEHRDELIERCQALGLGGSIGWVDSVEDVRPYYLAADLSISPSLSENHGAVLEASAMGVPSIVSDAGALPEALAPGAGWVFASGDPCELAGCLQDAYESWRAGDLDGLGAIARTHVEENFDLESSVGQVADIVMGREPSNRSWRE